MSRQGMAAAFQYGTELPVFSNAADAERTLFAYRDRVLHAFAAEHGAAIGLDYSPESLKPLEKWFFEHGAPDTTASGYPLGHALSSYLGETICRHAGFSWIVQAYAFATDRYEIGVQQDLLTIMLTKGVVPDAERNARMQSLWRTYRRYTGA
ncbi:hypothetical protein [Burkholderia sp. Ac-20353]|uniref:hypothetical protein n=1 Tax=Burkholderia sp. Ac-20353 TaxID=2703894 RepID=UPI00197B974C|nr:hypothetical protein [Burkholderia sp. Ac-20353]MBN3787202.1 hypothetical protein [Burkholderia sp. Ac-20353]